MADQGVPGFVRDASAADASAIAMIQVSSWTNDYDWPAEVFTAISASDPEMQWARAIIAPPGPGHRLLVATHGSEIVGFAALAPCDDPDAESGELEIVAWEVHPDHRARGHGSRLLAAVADHARSVNASSLSIWILPEDEVRRSVLQESGFAPDGAHRTVEADEGWGAAGLAVRQVRLTAGL